MFCSSCGNNLNEGARFCSKCGQQITQQVEGAIPKAPVSVPPVSVAPVIPSTVVNTNIHYQTTLDCFGGSMFSPNYVFMLIYTEQINIFSIPLKKLDRLIYDYIKEEGKSHKIKLFERNAYKKQYIENFKHGLLTINDHELASRGISKEILNFSYISKVKFQFNSSDMVYGEDDSYMNKTKGYILLRTTNGKYKYTHGYNYNKEMYKLLQNTFASLIKIHK